MIPAVHKEACGPYGCRPPVPENAGCDADQVLPEGFVHGHGFDRYAGQE